MYSSRLLLVQGYSHREIKSGPPLQATVQWGVSASLTWLMSLWQTALLPGWLLGTTEHRHHRARAQADGGLAG